MQFGTLTASLGAVVLLLSLTVALCFTPDGEVTELGESNKVVAPTEAPAAADGGAGAGEEGKDGAEAAGSNNDDLLTPWDKQGLQVIKSYADYNKKLQSQEKDLRLQLANPPETVKGIEYGSVHGYKYTFLGRTMKDKSRSECELVCSTYPACKSYSYQAEHRTCVWSMAAVKYSEDYTMYVKKKSPEGNHDELYNELAGLFIQDKLEPMKQGTKAMPTLDKAEKTTVEECKYSCTVNPECKTFSYSPATRQCVMSAIPVHYEPGWTYYEKEVPIEDSSWKKAHDKENDQKEELKTQWIQGSSAKARADKEKADKVQKALDDSKSAQTAAASKEKRARKSSDAAESVCLLAKAELAGTTKRNTHLIEQLEIANTAVVTTKQKRLDAEKQRAASNSYEATKKADLTLTFFDMKEVEAKAARTARDEKAEKQRKQKSSESKVKQCTASDIAAAEFAVAEGSLQRAEAYQKLLTFGEIVAEAKANLQKSSGELTAFESNERQKKMSISITKASYEGLEKQSQGAQTERDKKKALAGLEKTAEKLRKYTSQGEETNHQVMVAKEKQEKQKENTRKQEEKEGKAEHLLKSKKRENAMKMEAIRVKKKIKVREEQESKSEVASKALKKDEITAKTSQEVKDKGEKSLKDMTASELKKKTDLTNEEKTYKDVQKQKEMSEKSEIKHKENLEKLAANEKEQKYKKLSDQLKERTLRENEASAKQASQDATTDAKDAADKAAADELQEKTVASSLAKAATEQDTKALMREELNAKSQLTLSSETATKAQQQKMLAAEDLTQAAAKQQAEACVHICIEGLAAMNQQAMMAQGSAVGPPPQKSVEDLVPAPPATVSAPTVPPTETPNDVELGESVARNSVLMLGAANPGTGTDTSTGTGTGTAAEQELQKETKAKLDQAAQDDAVAASTEPNIEVPKVGPFMYNGCQC